VEFWGKSTLILTLENQNPTQTLSSFQPMFRMRKCSLHRGIEEALDSATINQLLFFSIFLYFFISTAKNVQIDFLWI